MPSWRSGGGAFTGGPTAQARLQQGRWQVRLASALHSGDPAFDALPGYFYQRLEPALGSLLDAAAATGEIRADISARDLLLAVALLCTPVPDEGIVYSQRMVSLLIDGLRYAPELQRSS